MGIKQLGFACGWGVAMIASLLTDALVEDPRWDTATAAHLELANGQQMLELPIRVVNTHGEPVPGARVTPWALSHMQGHGSWLDQDDRAGVEPKPVLTDKDGTAEVQYPLYRDVLERTHTTGVTLYVDHPDYALEPVHIDVSIERNGAHEVRLTSGVPVEVRPLVDGNPADLDDVFALWSDGRSYQPGVAPAKLADGVLRIPPMRPGENSFLLVKLDGDRATHFSDFTEVELRAGERKRIDVPLRPALRIEGILSHNVPRPVHNGRVKLETLAQGVAGNRVPWLTWAPVRPDGTFTIDGWPSGESIQLIALCEGYIATSGEAPDVVKNARNHVNRPPQMFDPCRGERIEVAMTPLVPCVITAVDEDVRPVAGVRVASETNIDWSLVRCERRLRERGDYLSVVDEAFPRPFRGETDAEGKLTLELPEGDQDLIVISDFFELPAFLGERYVQLELTRGERTDVVLPLQPRGTENLGEWEKLVGVAFGCSVRDGQQICALPGVRKQMDDLAKRFRAAKNPRDPQLLSEVYSAVADAFLGVGAYIEAAEWRQKAAEQAAKIEAAKPATAN